MNNTNVTHHMHRAITMAEKGLNNGEFPIGSTIVYDGNILAENYTQEQTQQRRIAHAEFLVLDAVDQLQPSNVERSEMMLFTTLEPCIMCLGAAMTFGIKTIYYAPGPGHPPCAEHFEIEILFIPEMVIHRCQVALGGMGEFPDADGVIAPLGE